MPPPQQVAEFLTPAPRQAGEMQMQRLGQLAQGGVEHRLADALRQPLLLESERAEELPALAAEHTCATHLVANGANIAYVQRLLGHRSLATTQRYSRVAIPEVRKTFARHPRTKARSAARTLTRGQIKAMRLKGPYEH